MKILNKKCLSASLSVIATLVFTIPVNATELSSKNGNTTSKQSLSKISSNSSSAINAYKNYLAAEYIHPNYGKGMQLESEFTAPVSQKKFSTLKQYVNGKRIYGSYVKIARSSDGSVIRMIDKTSKYSTSVSSSNLNPIVAVFKGIIPHQIPFGTTFPVSSTSSGNFTYHKMAGDIFHGDVVVEKVIISNNNILSEGWSVSSTSMLKGTAYEVLLDKNGNIVKVKNNALNADYGDRYRIFTKDPVQSNQIQKKGSLFPNSLPWLGTETQLSNKISGPNSVAFIDRNSDGIADNGGNVVTNKQFTTLFSNPASFLFTGGDVSVQNGFFHANVMHDVLEAAGFDQNSGNFEGNDPVNIRSQFGAPFPITVTCPTITVNFPLNDLRTTTQDFTPPANYCGRNNAFYLHAADGGSPALIFMLFNAEGFKNPDQTDSLRASDLDSDVVYHEYGHGVIFRLMDEFNYSVSSRAVYEGLSDVFAFTMNGDGYIGEYVAGSSSNVKVGIRSQPYHNYTKDLRNFVNAGNSQHANGEILAAAMWNIFAGPTIDTQPHAIEGSLTCYDLYCGFGRDVTLQYLMQALRVIPDNPTFLDIRDAMLDVTSQNCRVWHSFAKFGMGVNAQMNINALGQLQTISPNFSIPSKCPTETTGGTYPPAPDGKLP